MVAPDELRLADLRAKYAEQAPVPAFTRLYEDDADFGHMFAVMHRRLNRHFEDINGRAKTTHHYWADNSRDLIALIEEIRDDLYTLKRAGFETALAQEYEQVIERCEPWLSPSGGSVVPDDFELIDVIKYEPVFSRPTMSVKLQKRQMALTLTMIGEGSYAQVFSYVDPEYNIKFAVKRARRGIAPRDLARFKREFQIMKDLHFPYVVEVYGYDDERDQYHMEFCDETLRKFILKRNSKLKVSSRKRIALQFLYGMNYIHSRGLLHRDVSLQNILLKVFDGGAVLVKLSDFGLVKDVASGFTRTETELKGTIRDPLLHSLKEYDIANEIYAIGCVLSYIFTGRESLTFRGDEVSRIVEKCVTLDVSLRYRNVLELIADVEHLDATPVDAPA